MRHRCPPPIRHLFIAASISAFALGLAACGGGSTSSEISGGGGAKGVQRAEAELAPIFSGTNYGQPPTTAPRPEAGKNVWVIDVGLASEGGAEWAKAAQAAGKSLGWDVTVFDGKFNPSEYLVGIRSAIADKADGILLATVDCSVVKAGLEEARAAGIAISAVESFDCSEIDPGAPSLFDTSVIYRVDGKDADLAEEDIEMGRVQAQWVTTATAGAGKIILFKGTDVRAARLINKGFLAALDKVCPECEVLETVPFLNSDLVGPSFRQKLEQALLQNPTANAVVVPYDDPLVAGAAAAINSSGRGDALSVVAGTGFPAAVSLIRDDKGLDASYGLAEGWESYAGMDGLNRVFHGEKAAPSGIALGLVDREYLPKGAGYEPPVDYAAAYEKAWAGR